MAGSHIYTDKVAANMVRLITNKLEITSIFSRQNERDFNEGQPGGDTLRVKLPYRGVIRDGFGYLGANIDRRFTTITADQMFGIDVDWDTIEKAVQMERTDADINENILDPLAAQLAQECDTRAAQFVRLNTPNVTGNLGTTPTTFAAYTAVRTRMLETAGLVGAKRTGIFLTPDMMGTLVANGSNVLALFNPTDVVAKAFKEGYIGKYGSFQYYESMSLQSHTSGIWATVATGVTMNAAAQSGSSITVACTTGDTFNVGDKISIALVNAINPMTRVSLGRLKQFTITAPATGVASAATLSIYPAIVGPGSPYQNVSVLNLNNAIVTLMPGTTMSNATAATGKMGFGITNEAFALVAIDLPMPKKGTKEVVSKYTDPDTGIGVGVIRDFDFDQRKWKTRMDVWIGFGTLLAEQSSIMIASNT